jgi:hypothetical protein
LARTFASPCFGREPEPKARVAKYVKGYSPIAILFFEFIKKDAMFTWTPQCQDAFDALKEH